LLPLLVTAATAPAAVAPTPLSLPWRDKTLVVWAAPVNLTQKGGSALTIDDGEAHFDGIIFGELTPKKWILGGDNWRRTAREQGQWPEETADAKTFTQIAINDSDDERDDHRFART